MGSAALALAYVGNGRFDAFVQAGGLSLWDICAAGLIATEGGATVTTLDGKPWFDIRRASKSIGLVAARRRTIARSRSYSMTATGGGPRFARSAPSKADAKETMTAIPVSRLNHAVLYVRDVDRAVEFYSSVFGFEVVSRIGDFAAFMRAGGGDNHHDLGLFAVGPDAPRPPRGSTGLYHLAWEVPSIEDLATAARCCATRGRSVAPATTG